MNDYIPTAIAIQHSFGHRANQTPSGSSYASHSPEIDSQESLQSDDTSMSIDVHIQDSHFNRGESRQINEPASQRFEAFVGDNFGELAPSFTQEGQERGSIQSSLSQSGEHNLRSEVDLGSRSTIDIERQFINLGSEDMDYLRAKGL